jgi:hypothetical protein
MASLKQRNGIFYIQYYVGERQKRVSLKTDVLQIAKEKLRQFESAELRGADSPLPTRTPIAQVVQAYAQHIRLHKTAKSAQTDVYYLREAFGPVCPALEVTSRRLSPLAKKRPPKPGQDLRRRPMVIEAACFELITTADISAFIGGSVQSRGLAPKTAIGPSGEGIARPLITPGAASPGPLAPPHRARAPRPRVLLPCVAGCTLKKALDVKPH